RAAANFLAMDRACRNNSRAAKASAKCSGTGKPSPSVHGSQTPSSSSTEHPCSVEFLDPPAPPFPATEHPCSVEFLDPPAPPFPPTEHPCSVEFLDFRALFFVAGRFLPSRPKTLSSGGLTAEPSASACCKSEQICVWLTPSVWAIWRVLWPCWRAWATRWRR